MYYELKEFTRNLRSQKCFWLDGEFWTSLIISALSYGWFRFDPQVIEKIRQHFGDLLSTTSIIFGFALAALLFYIQAAAAWSKDKTVVKIADKIVDWHIWTIICMLFLIGWLLGLWALGPYLDYSNKFSVIPYAFLVFLLLYCGLQILNHTLTIWWSFRNRNQLNEKDSRCSTTTDSSKKKKSPTR